MVDRGSTFKGSPPTPRPATVRAARPRMLRHRNECRPGMGIARCISGSLVFALGPLLAGCQNWAMTGSTNEPALRNHAMAYLKQAIAYPQNATVRCQAIEALAEESPRGVEGWFIEALGDESPAVRFAACVALGRIRCQSAKPMIQQRLGDENHSVRAAAIFALHRMGDFSHSGELAEMLLYHKDKQVRGNVAMLFGLLGETKAIKLLKRAQKDSDYMVAWQALESQMLLGDAQAFGRVATQIGSGREDISVLAMLAVGRSREQKSCETLRYKLGRQEDHLESRLAAARALGMLGHDDGFELARRSLRFNSPNPDPRAGTPEDQIMRVRTMAALALGAMRARRVLPDLEEMMTKSDDPRIQVAAARAIIRITSDPDEALLDDSLGVPPKTPAVSR